MKLLVTGADGHLGTAVRRVIESDSGLTGVFSNSPRSKEAGVDVTDAAAVNGFIQKHKPDAVIHLPAVLGSACDVDPRAAEAVNVDSVDVLCAAALRGGVRRIVLPSTAAVYGTDYDRPVGEHFPTKPGSLYARQKLAAESILRHYARPRMQTSALRLFNVFGKTLTSSLVSKLLRSTARRPVELLGLDTFTRDYVHANDAAKALIAAATISTNEDYSLYNIGRGLATTNRQLVASLAQFADVHYVLGESRWSYSCADIRRASALLGYYPKKGLADALL